MSHNLLCSSARAVAWMETPWGWRWRSEALPCHAARCCASGRWFARQVTFMHGCSFCFVLGAPGLLVAVSRVGFQSNCSGDSSSRGLAISPRNTSAGPGFVSCLGFGLPQASQLWGHGLCGNFRKSPQSSDALWSALTAGEGFAPVCSQLFGEV